MPVLPSADFTTTAPACTEETVNFTNTGSTGDTYSWSFGDGNTSSSQNSTNAYTTAGNKLVKLVTTIGTCKDSSEQAITIHQDPTATFSFTAGTLCENTGVDFTNTGTTGDAWSYSWDFGEDADPSAATSEDPQSILYNSSGGKLVTFTISDANCSDASTQTVTISTTPSADFTTTAPACTEETVNFTNTGSTGDTYLWDFGDGNTSTSQNPTNIYATAGNKVVKLVTTIGTCKDSSIQAITIHQKPSATIVSSRDTLCENSEVDFNSTITPAGNWSYSWDFGEDADPATATSEDPQGIVYDSSGTKLVTFTISDANCSEVKTETITISTTPSADFTTTAPTCTEETVTFTNTGTTGDSYAWNFGDGNTSASQNPTNAYTTAGNKVVKLVTTITTIITCKDSSVQAITINQKPNSTFSFTGGTLCGNVGVDFDYIGGTTGDTWSYSWDFGKSANPPSSTSEDPQGVLYDSSGTHTVTFTISDANCSESSTQSITISPTPTASFTSTTPACTEDSVDFTNTGTTGANWNYNWTTFGSGASSASSTSENPTDIIYSTEGIKSVILVIVDASGNCSDTSTQTININFKPQVGFNSTAPVCAGAGVDFVNTGSSSDQWSYNWDFGKDAEPVFSFSEDPTGIAYSSGGTKTVTFSISGDNCIRTITQDISIDTLPDANAGIDTIICANRSVPIGSNSFSGYSYIWYPIKTLDDPTKSNPTASPEAEITVYYVIVKDNNTSCQNVDSIIVNMIPNLTADAGIDVIICKGDSVQIGSALIESQIYNWAPTSGVNNLVSPNPLVSPSNTTVYTITVTGAGCDPITDEVEVLVLDLPKADAGTDVTIAQGEEVQLIATGGVNYDWTPEYGLSNQGIFNPIANPDSTFKYYLKVTDIYGCINYDSITVTIVEAMIWSPNSFTPNNDGKNDIFYIRGYGEELENFELTIYNRWGKSVFFSNNMKQGWNGNDMRTNGELSSGAYVYIVKGTDNNNESIIIKGLVNLIR